MNINKISVLLIDFPKRKFKIMEGVSKEENMSTIGENIKKELERMGLSQKELCKSTKISESAMSKYLSSTKPLRTDILAKIARALDVNIYQLLGLEERPGTTFDVCKTALMARSGTSLTNDEKKQLIDLIFGHE